MEVLLLLLYSLRAITSIEQHNCIEYVPVCPTNQLTSILKFNQFKQIFIVLFRNNTIYITWKILEIMHGMKKMLFFTTPPRSKKQKNKKQKLERDNSSHFYKLVLLESCIVQWYLPLFWSLEKSIESNWTKTLKHMYFVSQAIRTLITNHLSPSAKTLCS